MEKEKEIEEFKKFMDAVNNVVRPINEKAFYLVLEDGEYKTYAESTYYKSRGELIYSQEVNQQSIEQ